ncbi:MAG: hypothetical protein AAFQ73_14975 [Pseudomonadota bacterium]
MSSKSSSKQSSRTHQEDNRVAASESCVALGSDTVASLDGVSIGGVESGATVSVITESGEAIAALQEVAFGAIDAVKGNSEGGFDLVEKGLDAINTSLDFAEAQTNDPQDKLGGTLATLAMAGVAAFAVTRFAK